MILVGHILCLAYGQARVPRRRSNANSSNTSGFSDHVDMWGKSKDPDALLEGNGCGSDLVA
jgi:hypothetical protein